MKIVHLTQYFLPWLGYQEFYLPREQIRMGHEVTVLSSNLRWPEGNYSVLAQQGVSQQLPLGPAMEQGVNCVRLPVVRKLAGRLVLGDLRRWLKELSPDAVISHLVLMPHTFTAAAASKKQGFKLIVDEHQLPSQAVPGLLHQTQRQLMARAAQALVYPQVKSFVAVAPGARDWLIEQYRVPRDLVHFIPLGVDVEVFRPDPDLRAAVRAELDLKPDEFLALYSGKISPYKKVETLIRAAGKLIAGSQALKVLIVGNADPDYLEKLKAEAAEQKVTLIIRPPAKAKGLAGYFNAADLCCWPADCTISHLEAAACGKPIVVASDARVEDRIANKNGVALPPGDVDRLADFIETMITDPAGREEMGRLGYEHVQQTYRWRSIAEAFDKLLSD